MVQVERSDGGPARGGEAEDAGFLPDEMIRPEVLAWMVKRRGEIGVGISGVRTVRFVQIAARAGEGQVFGHSAATAGAGDDVLEMKGGALKRLAHPAVLAAAASARLDQVCQRSREAHAGR